MKSFLEEMRKDGSSTKKAVCLLVLIGCPNAPVLHNDMSDDSLGAFPNEDVYRLVCVPDDDSFGITSSVQSLGLMSESRELYSSHPFLRTEATITDSLRSTTKIKEEAQELHKALLGKLGASK